MSELNVINCTILRNYNCNCDLSISAEAAIF